MDIRKLFRKNKEVKPDSRIVECREEINERIRKAISEDRFTFFELYEIRDILDKAEKTNDFEKYKFFYDVTMQWDKVCKLSRDAGEMINNICENNKDKILAIHRTFLGEMDFDNNIPSNVNLSSILNDGLINNGHGMQGGFSKVPELSLTTSPLSGFGGFINMIGNYKNNNVTVILAFPKEEVDEDLSFINEDSSNKIYIKNGNLNMINPSYILGALIRNDSGIVEYYPKEVLLSKSIKL